MACCLLKRIPRLFAGSTMGLLLIILTLQDGITHNNHGVNALLPPQRQLATQKRHQISHRRRGQPNNNYPCQVLQQQILQNRPFDRETGSDTIRLFAALPFYATDVSNNKNKDDDDDKNPLPPFLIESITSTPGSGDAIYKTIANLCIDVFFKVGEMKSYY